MTLKYFEIQEVLTIRNEDIGDEFCEFGIASGGNFKFYFKKYATSLNFGDGYNLNCVSTKLQSYNFVKN